MELTNTAVPDSLATALYAFGDDKGLITVATIPDDALGYTEVLNTIERFKTQHGVTVTQLYRRRFYGSWERVSAS
jgi:hypothetical protein